MPPPAAFASLARRSLFFRAPSGGSWPRTFGESPRASSSECGSFAFAQEVYVATRTRADVLAEVLAERASGALLAFTGEDSGSAWLARAGQAAEAMRFAALKR